MALEIPFGAKNKSLEISPTVSYILNFPLGTLQGQRDTEMSGTQVPDVELTKNLLKVEKNVMLQTETFKTRLTLNMDPYKRKEVCISFYISTPGPCTDSLI